MGCVSFSHLNCGPELMSYFRREAVLGPWYLLCCYCLTKKRGASALSIYVSVIQARKSYTDINSIKGVKVAEILSSASSA